MSSQIITFIVKEDGLIQRHGVMNNVDEERWDLENSESVIQAFTNYFNLSNDWFQCLTCIKFSPFGNYAQLQYEDTDTVNQIEVYWSNWI